MNHSWKNLLILFLLIPLTVLVWMAVPCAAGAEQGGNVTPELEATVETDANSVVSRVFMNMINRSIEQMNAGENPEEEDPSLAEYPIDERPLSEYGDSPRVRMLDEDGNGGETNYLVYRESILVIPQEKTAEYTVTYSEDQHSATLTPAISAKELAGRTGIVLTGDTVTDDIVLIFDGEPEEADGCLIIPLADTDSLSMNQLFSDGQLSISPQAAMTDGSEKADGKLRGASTNAKALSISNPLQKEVSGNNWSGRVYDFLPDLSKCDLDTDISIKSWSWRFNVVLYLAVKGKFDLTSTGSSGGSQTVEVGDISIPLPLAITLKMKYSLIVSFDDTPVHVEGNIFNRIGWSFGVGRAYLKDYTCDIDYTKFEVGRNGSYFTDSQYANKDIKLYIGSKFDYTGGFLSLHIPIVDVDIGPVISLTMSFTSGTYTTARWEKDLLDPNRSTDRTQPAVHICTETGKDGCLSVKGINKGKYLLYGSVNIYVKKWDIPLDSEPEKVLKNSEWYNSLTTGSGLQRGSCPHLWYRVPVRVWYDRVNGRPADGFTVYPSWRQTDDLMLNRDTTKNGGKAFIYLPYQARTRYEIVAYAKVDDETVIASAVQPSDMKQADNDPVDIVLDLQDYRNLSVQLVWDVDADELDIPDEVLVEVQRWDGERWVMAEDASGYPASALLHADVDRAQDWYAWFSNMPKYESVNGELTAAQYRIRALTGGYAVIHDATDNDIRPGEFAGGVFHVGSGLDRHGNLVPEHDTKYMAEYSRRQIGISESTTIRFTALYDVNLYKRWENIPEEERPDEVYLALLSRTDPSWGVGANYTMVTDPVQGSTVTLADIVSVGELDLDLPHIPERSVAVCRATPDNGWSGSFTIRKYKNGIPQEYMASELNRDIVNKLMDDEYLLETSAQMDEHDYISFSGAAYAIYNDYTLTATVINIKDGDDRHTISGVKYWVPDEDAPSYPDWIKLHVWEMAPDGTVLQEVGTVTLNRPEPNIPVTERVIWAWTLTSDVIDAAIYNYTVTEEFPADYQDAGRYYAEIYGTDVVNRWTWSYGPRLRIQKIWDRGYTPSEHEWPAVFVTLTSSGQGSSTTERIALEKHEKYTWTRSLPAGTTAEQAAAAYSIEEDITQLNSDTGLNFIPVYSGMDVQIINQIPVYTLTVTNMLQMDVSFQGAKQWILGPNMEGYSSIPDSLKIVLKRDGLEINRLSLDKPAESAFQKVVNTGNYTCLLANNYFTTDAEGNPLKRLADDGHLYVYSLEELPFEGMAGHGGDSQEGAFVEEIAQSNNLHTPDADTTWRYTYVFINRWVNSDNEKYVSLSGRKTWSEKDDNIAYRPSEISISVINHHDELVRRLTVTATDGWAWQVSGLPRYETDDEGNQTEIMYYVAESEIPGYTATYSADFDPVGKTWTNYDENSSTWTNFDEQTKTWTCDITNTLTGNYCLKVKKEVKGTDAEGLQEPFKFKITALDDDEAPNRKFPMPQEAGTAGTFTITGANEQQLNFLFSEDGVYLYRITEEKGENENWIYDEHVWTAIIIVAPKIDAEGNVSDTEKDIRCFLYDATKDESGSESGSESGNDQGNGDSQQSAIDPANPQQLADLEQLMTESDTVTFTNTVSDIITVKKEWDIDIEGKDHPETIEVVIQSKEDSDGKTWKTVKTIELGKTKDEDGNEKESWEKTVQIPKYRKKEGSSTQEEITYRVRELAPKSGLLYTLQDLANEYAGKAKDKFDEWIGKLKETGKSWVDGLPEEIRNAADEGYDKLAEKLDATENDIFSKLMEMIQFAKDEDRIVFDSEDGDKPEKKDDDEKEPETNTVSFKVAEYTSLTGGKVEAHETKYKVSYKKKTDDSTHETTYIIGNQAIMEADVVKRWLLLGDAEEDDKPESVFLVLLFKVDSDMAEKASSLGVDVSNYVNIELPVFNLLDGELFTSGLISGGMNPITLISEVVAGVDIDIFGLGDKVLKIAVAKVGEDDKWTGHFVMSKYMFGLPVEYKGAELGSEILRQVVKYLLSVDLSVSYTPFGNYISIPGKAYGNLADISLSNLFDLDDSSITGKIAGEVLDMVTEKLTDWIKEIAPEGLPIGLDDWQRVANVINIKIGIDLPTSTNVTKFWVNDKEEDRPDWIKLQVTATREDGTTEDLEITLNKADFKDQDEWTIELNDWAKEHDENTPQGGGDSGEEEEKDDNPITDAEIKAEIFPEGFDSSIYDQKTDGAEVTNVLKKPGLVNVFGRKIWDDGDNADGIRPETVTVRLLSKTGEDGWTPVTREVQKTDEQTGQTTTETKEVTAKTSAAGGWKYFFPNLPEKNGSGQAITYKVEEINGNGEAAAPDGYTSSGGTSAEGYNITNTHPLEKLNEITVKKVWSDAENQDGIRPDKVTVTLKANGATPTDLGDEATVDLSEAGNWEHTYTNVNKNAGGKPIVYTVDETEVPEGYEKSADGLTITNTHTPETVDITVKKEWDDLNDADGLRPETVKLKLAASVATPTDLQNPEIPVPEPAETSEADDWEHIFTGLPKYHEGQEIIYTADEEAIPGDHYTKTTDGLTVTNTHEYEKVTIAGRKVWDDDGNRDGLRPHTVWVYLIANGRVVDAKEAAPAAGETDSWSFSFENVPKNMQGQPIQYQVDEESVPGYEKAITGNANDGFTITNTHTPDTISVSGAKTWDDADDQDGIRPDSIRIVLRKDGEEWAEQTASAETGWKYSFANIEKNTDGVPSLWNIVEDTVEGYEEPVYHNLTPEGETTNFTINITNRHIPETLTVSGEKSWDDADNQDGKRPDSITVYLYADGVRVSGTEKAVTAAADGKWTYTFENVPKYKAGKEITYSVMEDPVPEGYTVIPSGMNLTNIHVPETVTVSGEKAWDDDKNWDISRPDSITVYLYADGVRLPDTETTVTADAYGKWKYSFENVPKYKAGQEIRYSVMEDPVPGGYIVFPSGMDLTNTYAFETIEVSGEKAWDDDNDRDGRRPESITVILSANGVQMKRQTVTPDENGKWIYSFPNMRKYRAGKEIVYTVTEEYIGGYVMNISGWNITNTHVPETTTISGEKFWDDDGDRDHIRPSSVTVILSANGAEAARQTVTADSDGRWLYSFENVPVYYDHGKPVSYMVSEEEIPNYYPVISGYNITNVHVPGTVIIRGQKTWDDEDNADRLRPSAVIVNLLADGVKINSQTVTAEKDWKYRFYDLPELDNGRKIVYTVEEEPVPDYTTTVSGYDLINKPVRAKYRVEWYYRQNGQYPDEPDVMEERTEVVSRTVNATDADKTPGRDYYFLDEYAENIFTGSVRSDNSLVLKIYFREGITIEGLKTWDDGDDQDGVRPATVTVKLLKNGTETGRQEISADNGWKYSFTNLPVSENGTDNVYTVDEEPVAGYEKTVTGYDITNTHMPAVTDVSGKKVWDDEDDQDRLRPDSVTVILYGNGNKYAEKTVTAEDGWKFTFRNVPENAKGKPVIYTVDEVPVAGYEKTVDGTTITNKHIPGTIDVSGTKTWDDEDNRNGLRPDSVTVKLLKNGTEIASRKTTADYDWKYSFANLPEAENGMVIRYTVKEDPVPEGYTAVINGYDIINSNTPAEPKKYTITYDPNSGTLNGSTEPVSSEHEENEVITIREAPVRKGYTFLYWKGSEYHPGDEYTVTEDHVFTAQWEAEPEPPGPSYDYKFTFTKKWSGGHGDSIDWTLYNPDGTVAHKKFNKKIVSDTEWRYEAWFASEKDYYIIETVPTGYKVRYENTGAHADVTDRCYNGGTIINYKIPKTGDNRTESIVWIGCVLLGLLGIGGTLFAVKRRKGRRHL